MWCRTAVGVDDDLTAGHTGVAVRSSDDEAAGRVDEDPGVLVHHVAGDDALYDLLRDIRAQHLVRHEVAVLRGDDNRIDADRTSLVVLDRHLRLAVGAQIVEEAVTPRARKALHELVREHDRQRHQLVGFGAGVAEHQPLIARAARIDAPGNVRRLSVDRGEHRAGVRVIAILGLGVADVRDGVADDLLEVEGAVRRDLASDDGKTRRHKRLARHARGRVLGQNRVEDGVGNLIRDLVGMSLGDGLRREEVTAVSAHVAWSSCVCNLGRADRWFKIPPI